MNEFLSTLFMQKTRKVGLLVPEVVISETHSDTLTIVTHPVEFGFNIADHAYMDAASLTMKIGFSGGGSLVNFMDTTMLGVRWGYSPTEIYQALRDMQRKAELLDVVTGKRLYNNMVITSLDVTTDQSSENVLFATLKLTEVMVTQTQLVAIAPKENMAQGATTSVVENNGRKAVKPGPENITLQGGSG